MERVADYRENARACRDLAVKMPPAQREQLMEMARQWERIAEEREMALRTGGAVPDPRPGWSAFPDPANGDRGVGRGNPKRRPAANPAATIQSATVSSSEPRMSAAKLFCMSS